jgi:Kdo2-lipid IVA lauroyltransferase/acyltransferase
MIDYLVFLLYKLVQYLLYFTPNVILQPLLNLISTFIYSIDKKHRVIARVNIDFVFKDTYTPEQKEKLIKESFRYLVYNFADMMITNIQSADAILNKVTFINKEYLSKPLAEGKSVIVMGAHNSNWELIMTAPPLAIEHNLSSAIGKNVKNRYINEDVIKARQRFGLQVIDPNGGAKQIIKILRQPSSVVGFLVDQNITRDPCDIVTFAGKEVSVSNASASVGMKMKAQFVPFWVTMERFGHYNIEFFPTLEYDEVSSESIHEMTQHQSDFVEKQVKKHPKEWLWVHKKFKAKHNKSYREQGIA